jgi:hypothetical protein
VFRLPYSRSAVANNPLNSEVGLKLTSHPFLSECNYLALEADTAILLAQHPSLSGINAESGAPCVVGAGGSVAVQELRLPLAGGLFVRGARRSTQYSVQCPRGRSHGLRKASITNKVAAPAGCYPPAPVRQGRVGPRGSEGGFLELLRWSNTIFTAGFYDWSDKDGERNGRQQNFCSSVGARDTKQWG